MPGTSHDLSLTFSYNPASQIAQNTRSNDAYSFTALTSGTVSSTVNGLNQLVTQAGSAVTHDARGNLTHDGSRGYTYSSENLLRTITYNGSHTLFYDPVMRLHEVSGLTGPRFLYDGEERVLEHDSAGAVVRRYVFGPGTDEPLVSYEGSGTSNKRFLHADERGSIIALSDSLGAVTSINRYDEYGVPDTNNVGAFGFTGQAWLPEGQLYYYKARMYDPKLPRFLQLDPSPPTTGRMAMYTSVETQ